MPKNKKPIYALAILAHPDDESYLLSGISLRLCEENKSVGIICATRGEKGDSKLLVKVTKKELAKIREQELRKACKILKAGMVEFLNYKDGELSNVDRERLTNHLKSKIKQIQPRVVITFGAEGITGHRDHITIGQAATAAAKQIESVEQVWRLSLPRSIISEFNNLRNKIKAHHAHYHPKMLHGVPDDKLVKIKISKYKKEKLQALYCHKSQGLPHWVRHKDSFMQKAFMNYEYYEIIKLR